MHTPWSRKVRALTPEKAMTPTALVMVAVGSVQLGSAVAKHLFQSVGPGGAVFLRIGLATVLLLVAWRPRVRLYDRHDYLLIVLFGLALAGMNFAFYSSLNRIPLGIAVTFEFVGPLGVAIAGSRRLLDGLWVALALGGIVLLAPWAGTTLDGWGVLLALIAGAFWAAYILLSARIGRAFSGGVGLTLAMATGTLLLAPVGIASAGTNLIQPTVLLAGLGLALLSSVIPYSLELEALRYLPTRVFGVLMSTEPAVAAAVGFFVLHQRLDLRSVVAIVLVCMAAAGASRFAAEPVSVQSV